MREAEHKEMIRTVHLAEGVGEVLLGTQHVGDDKDSTWEMTRTVYLAESVGEMLLGTQHVGDVHRGIVNGDTEVVHRLSIGAQDHEVAQRVGVPCDLATYRILDCDLLVLFQGYGARCAYSRILISGRLFNRNDKQYEVLPSNLESPL